MVRAKPARGPTWISCSSPIVVRQALRWRPKSFSASLPQLKRFGTDIEVDLRLRPDGGKGLLVRSYDGFGTYEVSDMEMWERFALGNARLVSGRDDAMDLVRHAAYALPLTPDRLHELLAMKRRIETERLKPQHKERDVKLGHGGLNDIEWTVHLTEMRYPTANQGGPDFRHGRADPQPRPCRIVECGGSRRASSPRAGTFSTSAASFISGKPSMTWCRKIQTGLIA